MNSISMELCGLKEEEEQGHCSQAIHDFQDQLFLQQMQQHQSTEIYGGIRASSPLIFPQVSPWTIPQVHSFNTVHDPFLVPPPVPSSYSGLFNRTSAGLQFAYDGPMGSGPFGLQAEIGKMTAQEILDAKALAASKSHSEAERRRRERINNHLAKLRTLLPSTTKTDKASLLAEVIQHVKELKRQTTLIAETSPVPTETDELIVDTTDEDGKTVIKASLCCEDRSDLLPDLIKTLKALRLRTLRSEITTLGGRVKNMLFITGEEEHSSETNEQPQYCISSIQEALKTVMEKAGGDESASGNAKRQRTTSISVLDQQQQQQHRSL